MNPSSVTLVRSSFLQVQALGTQAGTLFYETLFTREPTLRPLFKGDIEAQGASLLRMIGAAVAQLDNLPALLPDLQRLGERHAGYGVVEAHYDAVGAALLQTLAIGLGPAWTPPVREAWAEVYSLIAGVMVQVAAQAPELAPPARHPHATAGAAGCP